MKKADNVFLRKIGDVCYLQSSSIKDQYERKMIFLNSTGVFIWEQLGQSATVEDLINALVEEYDVERVTAQKDVLLFLDFLSYHGFLA